MSKNMLKGNLTGLGNSQGTPYTPLTEASGRTGRFNISVQPDPSVGFVGTYEIQKSIDGGFSWGPVTLNGQPIQYTVGLNEAFFESQSDVQYAIEVTQYTSGALYYVFNQ